MLLAASSLTNRFQWIVSSTAAFQKSGMFGSPVQSSSFGKKRKSSDRQSRYAPWSLFPYAATSFSMTPAGVVLRAYSTSPSQPHGAVVDVQEPSRKTRGTSIASAEQVLRMAVSVGWVRSRGWGR